MLKHFIISDEANEEFSAELLGSSSIGLNAYRRAPMQLRSAGVGIFAGAQVLSQLDVAYTANVQTKGVFRISDYTEARLAARFINLPDEAVPEIQNLSVGQLFFLTEGVTSPVRVKVDWLGDMPFDRTVARHAVEREKLDSEIIYAPFSDAKVDAIFYLDLLAETPAPKVSNHVENAEPIVMAEGLTAFIATAAVHPHASITQLYDLAGLSRAKGNRIKEEAEACGLIVVEEGHSTNGRPPKFVRLTQTGKALLHDLQG